MEDAARGDDSDKTRDTMQGYWKEFSPTLESMMLDQTASLIHQDEQSEILHYLPDIKNKTVLELGAGIGRYTGHLAAEAKHVTAVDFMEQYIAVNREQNGHLDNLTLIAADVMDLKLPLGRFDVVFSNWLLMYLNDTECVRLLQKILNWLSDDGYLFIRESCFHSSGNMRRSSNPTFYRAPIDYQHLLLAIRTERPDAHYGSSRVYGYNVLEAGSIKTYIKHKNNSYQIYFLASKMAKDTFAKDSFQQFLDQRQYTKQGVLRYEWMFGKTFLSTGGVKTTERAIKLLDLKPGQQVLDVGCGVGGHSFYMAEKFGAHVLGVDLSANMMSIAIEHLAERPHLTDKVKFVMCDVTKASYEENSFDAIYSRDTLLHIENKTELFKNFFRWMKPGGKLFFTDYTKGKHAESEEMKKYVEQRGYHLLTTEEYRQLLVNTGFVNVNAQDKTNEFLEALQDELEKLHTRKEEFLKEFSEEDYNYLEDGWNDKMQRVGSGDQTWTACYAEKPV